MKTKKIILPIVMLLLLIVATIGVTFAAFTFTKEGTVENVIESSTIMLTYTEGKTGIILNEAYPMSDDKGKVLVGTNNVFDFTVQATLGKSNVISYEVSAIKIPITDMTPLEDNEVKLYLERAIDPDTTYQEVLAPSNFVPIKNQTEVGSPKESMILDSGIFTESGTTIHNYRLKMWIDESAQIPNGESRKYGVKINVYAKQIILEEADEACFTFDSTLGKITKYDYQNEKCPSDLKIPNTINGVEVTSIGNSAFDRNQLTSVEIPDSVTSIENYAFSSNQLTKVKFSNNLINIGNCAFCQNNLTSVLLPDSLISIGNDAFQTNKLTSIIIPNNVKSIGHYAFILNQLENVIIPNNVTDIEYGAFNANFLPDNQAFIYKRNADGSEDKTTIVSYGGKKQDNVVIPNSVTIIVNNAFQYNKVTDVNIPNSVTTIGDRAFQGNQLTSVMIPEGVNTIGEMAFYYNQLATVTIGNSVTTIGNQAFAHNQLMSITIPDSVITIGNNAFQSNLLETVIIPDNVTTIGEKAFSANQLTKIEIGSKTKNIGNQAFYKNKSLSSNLNLTKIINKTGRSFDWKSITGGSATATFVTGTITHSLGNIIVTNN